MSPASEFETVDSITLTFPGERRFVQVARLVVAALATRLELPYEQMDDLELAVETVLREQLLDGATTTLELRVEPTMLRIEVGPLGDGALGETEGRETLDTKRLLSALVDRAEVVVREGHPWARLEDSIGGRG